MTLRAFPAPPGPEELAAILAAVEVAWPRPAVVVADTPEPPSAWRFSGRWWARPAMAQRARPWLPAPQADGAARPA